jgi:hypothetical protein
MQTSNLTLHDDDACTNVSSYSVRLEDIAIEMLCCWISLHVLVVEYANTMKYRSWNDRACHRDESLACSELNDFWMRRVSSGVLSEMAGLTSEMSACEVR